MYVRRAYFVLAVALAALAALPARAAQPGSGLGGSQWSVLVGLEDGAGDSGLQLRGDLEFPMSRLAPAVAFAIVGSVGYSRFGQSGGYYDAISGIDSRWDTSTNLLRFMGSARFTFGNFRNVRPYADAGLGIYYAGWSGSESVYLGYPYYQNVKQDFSDSDIGVVMRFAGGVSFQVSPAFALGIELGFQPYLGDVPDDTFTSLMASATFRM